MKRWDLVVTISLGAIVLFAIGLGIAAFRAWAPDEWTVAATSLAVVVTAFGFCAAYWAARIATTTFLLEATPVLVIEHALTTRDGSTLRGFQLTNRGTPPLVDIKISPWLPKTFPIQQPAPDRIVVEGEARAQRCTYMAIKNLGRYPTIGLKLSITANYPGGPGEGIMVNLSAQTMFVPGVPSAGEVRVMVINSCGVDVKLFVPNGLSRAIGPDGVEREISTYAFEAIDCPY
jgi:hypothetical protein